MGLSLAAALSVASRLSVCPSGSDGPSDWSLEVSVPRVLLEEKMMINARRCRGTILSVAERSL